MNVLISAVLVGSQTSQMDYFTSVNNDSKVTINITVSLSNFKSSSLLDLLFVFTKIFVFNDGQITEAEK